METNIVVVDDEVEIADLLELYLENEDCCIHKFYDSIKAYTFIKEHPVDLAILDIMMPGMDGNQLCRRIREEYSFPIIMLTAKDGELDKINGLTIGADDYITKPFTPLEVMARVKAQLRRYKLYGTSSKKASFISVHGLTLDLQRHICTLNEKELSLTPKEFSILQIFCENLGKVISPRQLFEEIWQEEYMKSSSNTIMVHIRHLREKMKDDSDKPKYIKTVWGVGYKIDE